MSLHLHRDLESLEQELLSQSSVVEQMIQLASQSLRELSTNLIERLMDLEDSVNLREVEIEEECLKLLALHQPVAKDLRRLATVMKINGDLERIADLAVNLGERAQSLVMYTQFSPPDQIDKMVEASISMVQDAIDAFVRLDADAARNVCRQDDVVDEFNRQCIESIRESVSKDPGDFEPGLQYFSASRHIERIADHATNIAEDVIYLVNGEITRHSHGLSL